MDEENEITLLASKVVDDANREVCYRVHYSCYCYLKKKEFSRCQSRKYGKSNLIWAW